MFDFSSARTIRNDRKISIQNSFSQILRSISQQQNIISTGLDQAQRIELRSQIIKYKFSLLDENEILPIRCDYCLRVTNALENLTQATNFAALQTSIDSFHTANNDLRYNFKAWQIGRNIVALLAPVLVVGIFFALALAIPVAAPAIAVLGFLSVVFSVGIGAVFNLNGEWTSNTIRKTKEDGLKLHGIFSLVQERGPTYDSIDFNATPPEYDGPPLEYDGPLTVNQISDGEPSPPYSP